MTLLERSALRVPTLPREAVPFAPLGGDVQVCGLRLSERLAFSSRRAALAKPQAGETEDQAAARAGALMVPEVLALTVRLADGDPALSIEEWESLGASHPAECLALFHAAMRLSGHDAEADRKN